MLEYKYITIQTELLILPAALTTHWENHAGDEGFKGQIPFRESLQWCKYEHLGQNILLWRMENKVQYNGSRVAIFGHLFFSSLTDVP